MSHKRLILFITFGIFLLTGCWSQKELTDLAFVSALGIDIDKEGKYLLTIQIVNPSNVASGKQSAGQTSPITIYSSSGNNIIEASRRATKEVSRRLYYAHANLIVISEELAKEEGIYEIFDAVERDPEFRTTTSVVIANGTKAGDIVKVLTPLEKIPANKVIKTLEFSEQRWGEFINVNIQDLIKNLISAGKEPVLSGFKLYGVVEKGKKMESNQQSTPETVLSAQGMAIFKDGKLIDWFEGEEARGTTLILNKVKSTGMNINWKGKKEAIAYEMVRQNTKVSMKSSNKDLPSIIIHVRAEGDIGEVTVPVNLNDTNVLLEIEKEVEKEVKKEIKMAVQHAQKIKSDIFGFGEAVHVSDPKEWKRLKHDWNDVHFPQLKVEVVVDAYVRRTGIRNKSYLSSIKD